MEDTHKKNISLFHRFLTEKGIYGRFICNARRTNRWGEINPYFIISENRGADVPIQEVFSHYDFYDWIDYAFDWSLTKEGHIYWSKINTSYRGFCDEVNRINSKKRHEKKNTK